MEHGIPKPIYQPMAAYVPPPAPLAMPTQMAMPKPLHYEQISFVENVHVSAQPYHHHPHHHHHHHHHHQPCLPITRFITPTETILVLFILLVIVSESGATLRIAKK